MGLLGEIYNVFALVYSSILAAREHDDFSRADWALIGATIAFVGLSVVSYWIQVLSIPWGYKCRFFWKSLLRGLLAPLLSLLHNPILFYSKGWVKSALTFSNEAYDGVERTRQLQFFELTDDLDSPNLYLTTHDLLRYGEIWGYDRLVGEIWVRVRFQANFNVGEIRKLQTLDFGRRLLLQYKRRATASSPKPEPIIEAILPNQGSVKPTPQPTPRANLPNQGSVKPTPQPTTLATVPDQGSVRGPCLVFICKALECVEGCCLLCICKVLECVKGSYLCICQAVDSVKDSCVCECRDLESGVQIPGTPSGTLPATTTFPQDPPVPYDVTITWRREICRIKKSEWCCCFCSKTNEGNQNQQPSKSCCMWNLKRSAVRKWTLFQIHQYMLCLDAWGNHPKLGIWTPEETKTRCSGCSSCCKSCSTKQLFRYCYRHDELVDAIDEGKRLTRTRNNATRYTVV